MANVSGMSTWRSAVLRTVLPVALTLGLFAGAAYLILLPALEEHLMAAKREMIHELTNTACELLADYNQRVEAGELTLEDAQARARARIGALRYGPEGKDYFWINDLHPRMVIHPYRPDLNGQDISDFADPNGKHLFVEMVAVVDAHGEGYVDYMWQWKDDASLIVPKLSFVKEFKPWGWIVGTGIYLDDVEAKIRLTTQRLNAILASILGIAVILSSFVIWQGISMERRRNQTLQALSDSERQLTDIIEFLPDATFVIDRQGRVTAWNRAMEQLTGVPADDMIGQGDHAYAVPFYGKRRPILIDLVLDPEGPIRTEYAVFRQDGTRVVGEVFAPGIGESGCHLNATASPLYDSDGRVVGAIESIRDVTPEMKLEEQLRQAQKVESIGRLAGGVAHDLNNLLSPILGYTEMLLADLSKDDPLRASIAEVEKAAERARDLTRQLLAFGRRQVLEMKTVNLNAVISGFEKMLRRTIREDIELRTELAAALGAVRADTSQIEQILMNLVVNSQDAMTGEGVITIATSEVELDEAYAEEHPSVVPGNYVMLAVSDTGVGMDAATSEKVFEPFFTTKEVGKGTGLGLSTVYGIVKQHEGSIWLYSEPGKGTAIKMYFPRIDGPADAAKESAPADRPLTGSESVIIAEDEPSVRRLVRQILTRHGYRILVAGSADACVAFMDQYDGPADLLITDVVMPHMNGRQLYDRLLSRKPHLKVLYVSGYAADTIARHGVLDDGVDLLEKPISVRALTRGVRDVLDR